MLQAIPALPTLVQPSRRERDHMHDESITDLDATTLSQAIHGRRVSCREVMQAYLTRIRRVDVVFNAIVSRAGDEALLHQADERDAQLARAESRGWLHGIPQAIKDTGHAVGFPSTYGCTLLADAMPAQDSLMTARMKAAGCIVIGKTNMPELGLGSHTFNNLFGITRNAWDPAVSAGGSSGGAAVALAQRLLPVADGSDFMGSLRNPAAWNHVFGLRPSQGRVPFVPVPDVWVGQLGTEGPMARSVRDLARLLETQAGFDARSPLSIAGSFGPVALPPDTRGLKGLRIAWLGDLRGHLAMESGLIERLERALKVMEREGAIVEPIAPPFDAPAVWHAWLLWRRALVAPRVAAVLSKPGARDVIKPEALWEHDQAQTLSATDFLAASEARSRFYQQMRELFGRFDVVALPATQCWPFPIEWRWPQTVAGREMDTYHRWMECAIYATFAGLPAISVPVELHANGRWPAGLQLIGSPQGDAKLLEIAAGYEHAQRDLIAKRPQDPEHSEHRMNH
jgi:amidase